MPNRSKSDVDEASNGDQKVVSMMSRVQERVDELRRTFNLPPGETFMDEFYCALHKKILLQGRVYVFENYVCFYSNLFGWTKQKVIPLAEVTDVSKRRNYGFPNSIQLVWKGKKEFFTSFLSREDAYVLIVNAWHQARLVKARRKRGSRSSSASSMNGEGSQLNDQLAEPDPEMSGENPIDSPKKNCNASPFRTTSDQSDKMIRPPKRAVPDSLDHDSDSDPDDDDSESWTVDDVPVPPVPQCMDAIMEQDFDVSVREFFQRVLSSESIFLEEYHRARGDLRYRTSQWQRHSGLAGRVKHSTFVSPVRAPGGFRVGLISPKETECNQNLRYRVYPNDYLVFETTQVMKDIPYGDNFTVETRWDVFPSRNPVSGVEGCHITVYAAVPFNRHVISPIRMMIESSVMKEVKESIRKISSMLVDTLITTARSVTETSVDFGEGVDGSDMLGTRYDNLDQLLAKRDIRMKLLRLLKEEMDEEDRPMCMRRHPSHKSLETISGELNVPETSGRVGNFQGLGQKVANLFRPELSNVTLVVLMVLIFVFQVINIVLWMFPPVRYVEREAVVSHAANSHLQWVENLNKMTRDMDGLHERLDSMRRFLSQAMSEARDALGNPEL